MSLSSEQYSSIERPPSQLRHYCRNQRCKSRLPAPVENPHLAFCCRGCFQGFYRHRCVVCEESSSKLLCHGKACRTEYRTYRHRFVWDKPERSCKSGPPTANVSATSVRADFAGSRWPDKCGRGWRWETSGAAHVLVNREGASVARIVPAAGGWSIVRPKVIPAPGIDPDIESAKPRLSGSRCGICPASPWTGSTGPMPRPCARWRLRDG